MDKDKLTSKHLVFIVWGVLIVSIKTNITVLIKDVGRDVWIVVFIASIIGLLFFIYTINTCVRNNNFNFVGIYHKAFGKVIGTILLFFFIANLILTLIECAAVEANAMHTNIFIETPPWYLLLFFIIPAIYTIKNGIVPIITVVIIGIILAMIAGVNLVILTSKYKEQRLLLPIFANGLKPGFYFALLKSIGFYGSLSIMFPYFDYIQETKKIKKFASVALLFVMQMHVVSSAGAISSFGELRASNLAYPKLTQTQQINYFGFLESGEFFVMFQIIGGWFMKYILTFHAILKILKDLKFEKSYILFALSALVLVISNYFASNLLRVGWFLNYYANISLVNFIVIPFIVFSIFARKQKHEKVKKKSK